ncbi:hypothetical protein [Bradyrhizobium liaoningense]|uniref:hypothetical protein n=1 Tax=Bradyrhizobium liaoningense TaxID=43992 RepID=UPI001BAB0900|nr:hypothetical protein [Bradyrhizobium liaoningense]MBR0820609.1 hypothetical protein [Bradyrhizobium liaoningense]
MLCYQRPESVVRRMARYSTAKGHDAFLSKLSQDPAYFGRQLALPRYGSRLPGLPLRREAQQAAALLPLLAKEAFEPGGDPYRFRDVSAPAQPKRPRRAWRTATDHVTAFTT